MSDSKDSTITYTAVSSPFGGLSDIGSPGVDGPPVMPEDPYAYVVAAFQAPPSPDYVSGPEYPPLSEFVPEPVYPKFMPPEDDVLLAEEQPLPTAVSPTADSPGYVPESDLEEDPKEDEDEDPEEDPADYPADRGDDGDDEDESSDDDEDDDDVDIEEDEEEEEHLALADSTAVAFPAVEHASSVEETELLETDESAATPLPHHAYRVTARISIRAQTPVSLPSDTEIPSLPLPPILSPLPVSPPLPVSSPPLPASPTYPLEYRAAMIRLRAKTRSTSHPLSSSTPQLGTPPLLPIHLPTSSPPMLLPSTIYRAGTSEVTLPPQKRLCTSIGTRYEVGNSSSAPTARPTRGFMVDYGFVATLDDEIRHDPERYVGYGITDTWDEMLVDMPGAPATDETELGQRLTNFVTTVRQDTNKIYVKLDEAQDDRLLMSGRLNTLFRDRRAHTHTALLMKRESRLSHEAWVQSMDASDLVRSEVMELRTQVIIDQGVTTALAARDADRNTNGDDSHNSGTGVRRMERVARECTYPDFMK
ncbi:hypothetical protein Tco_0750585 [Tanacetum coccineum]|uniref:Uncharacterized protein n=1 Tax=Tanacetum coccineum TaxID=301880 RepID=A0ABQ4Z1M0_9ASTR